MKKIILSLFSLVFCIGCGSLGTIKSSLNDPAFQTENLPIRELRIAVLKDGCRDNEEIYQLINEASKSLKQQVGMTLQPVSWMPIEWKVRNLPDPMVNQIEDETIHYQQYFDIAVAPACFKFEDYVLSVAGYIIPLPIWLGAIDDDYRRFIVLKTLRTQTFLHEIFHAFLFDTAHSGGIMKAIIIELIPGLPINQTVYLTPEDRKKVLSNKWRDFNVKPEISGE